MSVARHVGLAVPLTVCLLLANHAWSAPAAPTKADRVAARDAYDKGTLAFDKGDYAAALDGFMKANAIIPSVQAAYWIAQAHDRLGHTEIAIKSYEDIQAREDFSKLSADKASMVRDRLTALKSPPPPPPPPVQEPPPATPPPVATSPTSPPPAEASPTVTEPPPPTVIESPPAITPNKLLPKANTVELGIALGTLFVANSNNLVQDGHLHANFEKPVWQLGARAAYFPLAFLGIEAEWEHGFGRTPAGSGKPAAPAGAAAAPALSRSARFDSLRGHVIGQLPDSQFVPFALLGAGVLHVNSDLTGADTDVALHAGVGAKMYATKLLVPRVDLRLNMTQRRGGGFSEGLSVHPEILLGLAFRLGG